MSIDVHAQDNPIPSGKFALSKQLTDPGGINTTVEPNTHVDTSPGGTRQSHTDVVAMSNYVHVSE
jgi:hypothetical protein